MLLEIFVQLLYKNQLTRRPNTYTKDDLFLVKAEDLVLLDQVQCVSVDELARELGQILLMADQ